MLQKLNGFHNWLDKRQGAPFEAGRTLLFPTSAKTSTMGSEKTRTSNVPKPIIMNARRSKTSLGGFNKSESQHDAFRSHFGGGATICASQDAEDSWMDTLLQ
eukprot:433504-Amphidinium_carterae.1